MDKQIICKFCGKDVWWDDTRKRVVEIETREPHIDNCPRRQSYHKDRGYHAANVNRGKRSR